MGKLWSRLVYTESLSCILIPGNTERLGVTRKELLLYTQLATGIWPVGTTLKFAYFDTKLTIGNVWSGLLNRIRLCMQHSTGKSIDFHDVHKDNPTGDYSRGPNKRHVAVTSPLWVSRNYSTRLRWSVRVTNQSRVNHFGSHLNQRQLLHCAQL